MFLLITGASGVGKSTVREMVEPEFADVLEVAEMKDEEAQRHRLEVRGEDPALLPHHVAFTDWMREHVVNPSHRPDVITQGGWERMQWDRWVASDSGEPPWDSHIIDTTDLHSAEVGARASAWIRRQVSSPPEKKV